MIKKGSLCTQLMHMTVTSQFRRSSCSPLEVQNLHTLRAAVFTDGPFFFRFGGVQPALAASMASRSVCSGSHVALALTQMMMVKISASISA